MSNIAPLTNYFLSNKEKFLNIPEKNKEMKISKAYSDIIYNLWDKKNMNGTFNPHYFKEIIRKIQNLVLNGNIENDSIKIILFLYERIHKELNEINNNNNKDECNDTNQIDSIIEYAKCISRFESQNKSIIKDIFYFCKADITKCLKCETKFYTYLMDNNLKFPLDEVKNYKQSKDKNNVYNDIINIYDCFEYYTLENNLNDLMDCKSCNQKSEYTKYSKISSYPEVLTIFLTKKNRDFEFEIDYYIEGEKLMLYTIKLGDDNMMKFKYELISVVIEIKDRFRNDGRYLTYCKSPVDKKWYLYDFSKVENIPDPTQTIYGIPFLLYYQKIKEKKD